MRIRVTFTEAEARAMLDRDNRNPDTAPPPGYAAARVSAIRKIRKAYDAEARKP